MKALFEESIHRCRQAVLLGLFLVLTTPFAGAESLLLTGATVHTVTGATITNGQVLVENGLIRSVGTALEAAGATRVDLAGQHLYPGMIALNTELGLQEIEAVRATLDYAEVGDFTPDVESWIAVNPDSELIPVARANGVAYFEPAPEGGIVAGQSGLMAVSGWTSEDMVVKKPIALHLYWPAMALDTTPKDMARNRDKWKSLEDQAKQRTEKLKAIDDFFADARAYAKARDLGTNSAAVNPPWEAMRPFLRGELPVAIHADEFRQIASAVEWATTNQLKVTLVGGRDAWRLAVQLATNQIPVVYQHTFTLPSRDTDPYDVQFKAPSILQKAGVHVTFTTGGATLVMNLPYEAAQAVAFGLPPEEAVRGLTLYPAQIAGVADRLGSIAPGKDATLFVANGDILDIRTHVRRLWVKGNEVSLENRHTRLYEKYRNRPKPTR
jgi:imidazolonepropionase-like amidohydrolase